MIHVNLILARRAARRGARRTHGSRAAHPAHAVNREHARQGRGVARCVVAADGTLTDCSPETGDPDGLGFSEVAVKLASTMKMNPWTADGRPVDGAVFRIAIRLNLKQQP